MKRFLLIPCLLLVLGLPAGQAFAQAGGICLYSDASGSTCSFNDTAPGIIEFYVIHTDAPGATACQFAAPVPSCMIGAAYLADSYAFPVAIGNSQTGVSIAYGACLSSPIHVMTINVFGNGLTSPDCAYPVAPDPTQTHVIAVDCTPAGLVAAGGTAFINSSLPCDCNTTGIPPVLDVAPLSITFGSVLTSADVQISNTGGSTLNWNISDDRDWINVIPSSGSGNQTVSVNVDRSGLSPGNYSGSVTVTSNGGTKIILVQMSVVSTTPVLGVNPTSLTISNSQTTGNFFISNLGGGTLNWSLSENVPWLMAAPTSGANTGTVTVTVDRTGLLPGSYSGNIGVNSNGGSTTVTVHMNVVSPTPVLGVSPPSLSFSAGVSQLSLSIFNSGNGTLTWSISPTEPWLSVNPDTSSGDQTVTVAVDRTGLPDGNYSANLNITSNGGNTNVPVMMTVTTVPILALNPTFLAFSPTTTLRFFQILNVGVGTITWGVQADQPWITVLPPQTGSGETQVWVQIDTGLVPPGVQTGHVDIVSNGGNGQVTVRYDPSTPTFPGVLMLTGDYEGTTCEVFDGTPGLLQVHIVHTNTPGVTGCEFAAPVPGCMLGAVWLSDTYSSPVQVGNTQQGVSVAYGACLPGPIHVVTMNLFVQGLSQTCCQYNIVPHPLTGTGQIIAVNCVPEAVPIQSHPGFVNPDPTCVCGLVKVEETTWGKVKSLYAPAKE